LEVSVTSWTSGSRLSFSHELLLSLSSKQRTRFEALVNHRKAALRDLFFSLGMDSLFLQVGEPFLDPLMTLLERRKKG
jgi:hypothetical protein